MLKKEDVEIAVSRLNCEQKIRKIMRLWIEIAVFLNLPEIDRTRAYSPICLLIAELRNDIWQTREIRNEKCEMNGFCLARKSRIRNARHFLLTGIIIIEMRAWNEQEGEASKCGRKMNSTNLQMRNLNFSKMEIFRSQKNAMRIC